MANKNVDGRRNQFSSLLGLQQLVYDAPYEQNVVVRTPKWLQWVLSVQYFVEVHFR